MKVRSTHYITKLWRYILTATLGWLCLTTAVRADVGDEIKSYDVDLHVQTDGTVDVHEVIRYSFGDFEPAHGIERFIPTSYSNGLFGDKIDVQLHSVTDDQGADWPVDTRYQDGYVVWQIGSPATTVTGEQTYVLDYTTDWVLTDYKDYVELYWDAIGTEWNVPIQVAHIRVTVPPNSQLPAYPAECYFGAQGDSRVCDLEQDNDTYSTTIYSLEANQGATVLFAFAPQTIHLPTGASLVWHWISNNWSLLLIPGWVLLGLILWILNRRVKPSKSLIPIYEIPEGISSPAMAEYLLTGKITTKTFAAELIEAARLGELELIYDPEKAEVKSLRSTGKAGRTDATSSLLRNQLFAKGTEIELKKTTVSSNAFLMSAKSQSDQAVRHHGWLDVFKKNIKLGGGVYGLAGFIIGGFMIASGNSHGGNHLIVTGVIFMAFGLATFFIQGSHLPLNTAGADARRLVEGFKWFLGVTETERLKFSQVPKLTPKMFEEYLPYAIVFGVEKQWVKQFENILKEPPQWMHGVNQGLLYSALLSTGRVPQQFKVPVSARSGGSGFGGGGFSGGGFGGGGGGRW